MISGNSYDKKTSNTAYLVLIIAKNLKWSELLIALPTLQATTIILQIITFVDMKKKKKILVFYLLSPERAFRSLSSFVFLISLFMSLSCAALLKVGLYSFCATSFKAMSASSVC